MAEPTITITETTAASAEADVVQQLAWTEALDAPLMLLAPLLAGWVFVRHYKRARAAQTAHAMQHAQTSTAVSHPTASSVAITLEDARETASKRSRHG